MDISLLVQISCAGIAYDDEAYADNDYTKDQLVRHIETYLWRTAGDRIVIKAERIRDIDIDLRSQELDKEVQEVESKREHTGTEEDVCHHTDSRALWKASDKSDKHAEGKWEEKS